MDNPEGKAFHCGTFVALNKSEFVFFTLRFIHGWTDQKDF
jgi:hypothetical protein